MGRLMPVVTAMVAAIALVIAPGLAGSQPAPTPAPAPQPVPSPAPTKEPAKAPPAPKAIGGNPAGAPVGGRSPGAIGKLPTIETFTLANGLAVAVLASDAAPVVAVQVWYHAGSKDEPRDRRGSAHMFEHMMFKGTAHVRAEAHAQFINGIGGYVNAQTDEDATHYINTLPADYLDFAIKLEAERMRNLMFRPEMIAVEREVVKEEIRQQENSPI
ncbi:MAG: peptidase domain protein, partial [Deltaproteobacteria bacterium]|nr:peptidase domain protein [Deltaproteobacteria bacterium]